MQIRLSGKESWFLRDRQLSPANLLLINSTNFGGALSSLPFPQETCSSSWIRQAMWSWLIFRSPVQMSPLLWDISEPPPSKAGRKAPSFSIPVLPAPASATACQAARRRLPCPAQPSPSVPGCAMQVFWKKKKSMRSYPSLFGRRICKDPWGVRGLLRPASSLGADYTRLLLYILHQLGTPHWVSHILLPFPLQGIWSLKTFLCFQKRRVKVYSISWFLNPVPLWGEDFDKVLKTLSSNLSASLSFHQGTEATRLSYRGGRGRKAARGLNGCLGGNITSHSPVVLSPCLPFFLVWEFLHRLKLHNNFHFQCHSSGDAYSVNGPKCRQTT